MGQLISKELLSIFKGLSKDQMEKFKAISWLLNPDGPRGSGRTYLMALSFIKHSLTFNRWVSIYNHGEFVYAKNEMISTIKGIVEKMNGVELSIKSQHKNYPQIKVRKIGGVQFDIEGGIYARKKT